jgi:hypothetical protein
MKKKNEKMKNEKRKAVKRKKITILKSKNIKGQVYECVPLYHVSNNQL